MNRVILQHRHTAVTIRSSLSAWHSLRALWRRWLARRAEASRRRRELRALCELSDATLRDLGLARSELGSIQAEIDGRETATRRRVWQ